VSDPAWDDIGNGFRRASEGLQQAIEGYKQAIAAPSPANAGRGDLRERLARVETLLLALREEIRDLRKTLHD
jgi:hypothetical protein